MPKFLSLLCCRRGHDEDLPEVPVTPAPIRAHRLYKRDIEQELQARMASDFYPSRAPYNYYGDYMKEGRFQLDGLSVERERSCESRDDLTVTPSLSTPDYVKNTIKVFEKVSPNAGRLAVKNRRLMAEDSGLNNKPRLNEQEKKTPSYVGVSCSNSGYIKVLNYDSDEREGFRSSRKARESLMTGALGQSNTSYDLTIGPSNGVRASRPIIQDEDRKFINISTSTETISTFRSGYDTFPSPMKVSLESVIGGHGGESPRSKIVIPGASQDSNCNSFLKNIKSFENSSKLEETVAMQATSQKLQRISLDSMNPDASSTSKSFIQQRIERLYGPTSLAQGYYTPNLPGSRPSDSVEGRDNKPHRRVTNPSETQSLLVKNSQLHKQLALNKEKELATKLSMGIIGSPSSSTTTSPSASVSSASATGNIVMDGHYFQEKHRQETVKLSGLAAKAEKDLENGENLPEEISGKLRSVAGQAGLMVRDKMKQFEGLCQNNLAPNSDSQFLTTNEDLQGFWDMISIQITQLYSLFDEIEVLRRNNWTMGTTKVDGAKVTNTSSKTKKKKEVATVKATEKVEAAKKAREELRKKMLEDRKKMMKELKGNGKTEQSGGDVVEFFSK